jgi:hypothetical protein
MEGLFYAILTRADIINGKKNIQTFKFKELNGELKLRPLTDGELSRVIARMNSGGFGSLNAKPVINKDGGLDKDATMKNLEIDIGVEEAAQAKYNASCLAVAISLDHDEYEDKFTEDDIKQFPAGSVDAVASKVFEISGVADPDPERVQRFRGRK